MGKLQANTEVLLTYSENFGKLQENMRDEIRFE